MISDNIADNIREIVTPQAFTDDRSKAAREAEVNQFLLHDNFSYMELLCGQIDMTKLYGNTGNVLNQVRTKIHCKNSENYFICRKSYGSTIDAAYIVVNAQWNCQRESTWTYSNHVETQGSKSRHDVFPCNSAYPSSSSTYTAGIGEFFQESNTGHDHFQENPWDSNMFQDIELDELDNNTNKTDESYEQDFDHT